MLILFFPTIDGNVGIHECVTNGTLYTAEVLKLL
jgi:hypothetical protein